MGLRSDRRTPEGRAAQAIYTTPRWRRLRERIFVRDLAKCAICKGIIVGRYHVDHIKAHKNDPALIWDEANLQLLHPTCHNSLKQAQEAKGYSDQIGADGFPVDISNHPFYK